MRRGFTIHHNGPPAKCVGEPHSRCVAFWEAVVRYHTVDKGWSGVAYSWGICPHGERFEGQGWNRPQFANGVDLVGENDGRDSEWYTVLVFVGGDDSTGDEEKPTAQMVDATAALIDEGRRTGRCDLAVRPHSDWKRKPCPGPTFTSLARIWDGAVLLLEEDPSFVPDLPEESDMFLYTAPGKATFFCSGGVSVGLNEASDLPTFEAAQVPKLTLDDDTYEKFRKAFPGT